VGVAIAQTGSHATNFCQPAARLNLKSVSIVLLCHVNTPYTVKYSMVKQK
jgi:hypothetical protein